MAVAPEQALDQQRMPEGESRPRGRRRPPRFGQPSPQGVTAYDEKPYGWAPVVILVLVAIVDRIESSITAGVLPLLQEEFGIGDAVAGAIPTAVIIAGAIAVLPAGYIADRYNRTNLISLVVLSWVFLLVFNALAVTFAMFFAVRVLLGAADSIDGPASRSLLGDYYASRHRPKVYGWARLTTYIGGALGTVYGGVMGQLAGWRLTYLFVAIPGAICVWLMWELREPARGFLDQLTATGAEEPQPSPPSPDDDAPSAMNQLRDLGGAIQRNSTSLGLLTFLATSTLVLLAFALSWAIGRITDLGALLLLLGVVVAWGCWRKRERIRTAMRPLAGTRQETSAQRAAREARQQLGTQLDFKTQIKEVMRIPTLRMITIGFATLSFGLGGISFWIPTLLNREFGLDVGAAGTLTGMTSLIGLVGGTLYGMRLGRVWHGTRKGGRMVAGGGGLLIGSLLFVLALMQPTVAMFALLQTVSSFFMAIAIPNLSAALADVLVSTSRGIGFSLLGFVIAATAAWGPTVTGIISDAMGSLNFALYFLGFPGCLGAVLVLMARQTFDRDVERQLDETRQSMGDSTGAR